MNNKEKKNVYHKQRRIINTAIYIPTITGVLISLFILLIVFEWIQKGTVTETDFIITMLGAGLAIISLTVATWAALNISTAIENSRMLEIIKSVERIERKLRDEEEDIEGIKRLRLKMGKESFLNEVLRTYNTIESRIIYSSFSDTRDTKERDYEQMLQIERLSGQLFQLYRSESIDEEALVNTANKVISAISDLCIEDETDKMLFVYKQWREAIAHFYKGYCMSEGNTIDEFRSAAKGFYDVCDYYNIPIPEKRDEEQIPDFVGVDNNREMAVVLMNTMGESYSMIVHCYNQGKSIQRFVKEEIEELADKAVFYCKCACNWADKLEPNETIIRNLGCAYERRDLLRNEFGLFSKETMNCYIKAFENAIKQVDVDGRNQANIYHVLLIYYLKYVNYKVNKKNNDYTIFRNKEELNDVLQSIYAMCDNDTESIIDVVLIVDQIATMASEEMPRRPLHKLASILAKMWILLLVFSLEKNMLLSKGLESNILVAQRDLEAVIQKAQVIGFIKSIEIICLQARMLVDRIKEDF